MLRKVQHRSEIKSKGKLIREMSHKNPEAAIKKLKKQIQRLKKELLKNENINENFILDIEELESEQIAVNGVALSSNCPKCSKTNIGSYTTPSGKIIKGCRSCKHTFR